MTLIGMALPLEGWRLMRFVAPELSLTAKDIYPALQPMTVMIIIPQSILNPLLGLLQQLMLIVMES